ncbi:unnamed protein product [Merluccius merluccius]
MHTPARLPTKRAREDAFESRVLEVLDQAANRTEDPDEQFLKSLLPMMRQLHFRRKEELKMNMHQMVYQALYMYRQEAEGPTMTEL